MSKILVENQLKYACQVNLEGGRDYTIKFVARLLQFSLDLSPFMI